MTTHREIKLTPTRSFFATPVLDSYWRWAAERQAIFFKRTGGESPPWTSDPIIAEHRFTNVYRASDRVSQYLIRNIIYSGPQEPEEILFRILLFKIFNRISTHERLVALLCEPVAWATYDEARYDASLGTMLGNGLYSAAYIMPDVPQFGGGRKHINHLRLIEHIMRDGFPEKVQRCDSLQALYKLLRSYPSLGDFLAFQLAIDINYSPVVDFSELEFVVAGPGAKGGIKKCFSVTGGLTEAQVIKVMQELQDEEFARLDLRFHKLGGSRPLQLIDCQGMFCETDKYARVAHPEAADISGRTKIKQKYRQDPTPLPPQFYPPKWGLNEGLTSQSGTQP